MKPGKGANTDRKLALIRKGMTRATTKYGLAGRVKKNGLKVPTLPRVTCLEEKADDE